jgi:hypothetical protein
MFIRQRSLSLAAGVALCAGAVAFPLSPAQAQPGEDARQTIILEPLTLEEVERDSSYRLISRNGLPIAAPRAAYGNTRATCTYAGGSTKTFDWTGKNPSTCGQYYRLYVNGKLVFAAQTRSGPNIWGVVGQGYTALQKWCSRNSMTCGVVTSVGTLAVASLLG